MKRILLESPREFAVREAPTPAPAPGEVLVAIRKVGICGSDMELYRQFRIGEIRAERPHVIGHECMGVVEAAGEGVDQGLVGARVAVEPAISCGTCECCTSGRPNICPDVRFLGLPPTHGAFQQYIVHPAHLVEPIPDGVSDEAAVVLEPMAIALHAVNLVKVRPGQDVVILGTGVLGTCVLALLSLYRGVRTVCVDLMPDRLERAAAMGADAVVRPDPDDDEAAARQVLDAVGGEGADVVFECAGAHQTMWNMCEVAEPGAHIAIVGITEDDRITFSSGTSRRKGLTLRLVRRSLRTLPACIDLAARGLIEPQALVTHTFAAADISDAFRTVDGHADGVLKALVDMDRW